MINLIGHLALLSIGPDITPLPPPLPGILPGVAPPAMCARDLPWPRPPVGALGHAGPQSLRGREKGGTLCTQSIVRKNQR